MNPVEFGRLLESVKNLTSAVTELTKQVTDLEKRLDSIVNTGKGVMMSAKVLWAVGGAVVSLAFMQAKYLIYLIGHAQ